MSKKNPEPGSGLPENLTEFSGCSRANSQNDMNGTDFAWRSPLIGLAIPVH